MLSAMTATGFLERQQLHLQTLTGRSKISFSRYGFPRNTIPKRAGKSRSLEKTRVCCNIHDNHIAKNISNKEVILQQARLQFCEEVSFTKQDQDVCPVKALMLLSAEDEAFMSLNREKDKLAASLEGRSFLETHTITKALETDVNEFPIAGRTMRMWSSRFDFLVKEVIDVLAASKVDDQQPVEILKACSTVMFRIQQFRRSVMNLETKNYYLHLVLTLGSGSGLLLSIIYMEICKRLGVTIRGAEIGDDELFMWPLVEDLYECFKPPSGGKSWFSEMLAFQHQSHLMDRIGALTNGYKSSSSLKFVLNRDLVGMVLSQLKYRHWEDACQFRRGFAVTDPLHPLVYEDGSLSDCAELTVGALLRPRNLRLALMASERLLLLKPHSWVLRRDHGLLLYHSRRYAEAVLELSICTAFAPTKEAHVLEHFVEKLHLLRLESSWSSSTLRSGQPSPSA